MKSFHATKDKVALEVKRALTDENHKLCDQLKTATSELFTINNTIDTLKGT